MNRRESAKGIVNLIRAPNQTEEPLEELACGFFAEFVCHVPSWRSFPHQTVCELVRREITQGIVTFIRAPNEMEQP